MKRIIVEKDAYYDSVFLMLINRDVNQIKGVKDAVVSMGTELNLELLSDMGYSSPALEQATPNDLIIAVEAESGQVIQEAVQSARNLLNKKKSQAGDEAGYRPVSLDTALKMVPEANLLVVSVPGIYAAREVRNALERDLHVMLFSDNVSLEDEIALKKLAVEKGLLMMGPDCGTAIINGKPLCFANVVRPGDIGIVAASGTGLQEVSCCIHALGAGLTQGIGTGGRDLKAAGGRTMLMGIEALKQDPRTKVIVVVSKPPAKEAAALVTAALEASGKDCVVHFIGLEIPAVDRPGVVKGPGLHYAGNLEEAAGMAVALSRGQAYQPAAIPEAEVEKLVQMETAGMAPCQQFIRGLYTGGTLADEALFLLDGTVGRIYSNNQTDPDFVPADAHTSREHTIVDLGDDLFTVGRPHPMIDPSTREERIAREMEDPQVALLLLDVVLGYGSHEDPAGAMVTILKEAKERTLERGGYLSILASITGTEADFQNMEEQREKLQSIGCVVMPSNFQASLLAKKIIEKVG